MNLIEHSAFNLYFPVALVLIKANGFLLRSLLSVIKHFYENAFIVTDNCLLRNIYLNEQ